MEEALETILYKTTLKFVWLDIKSPNAVDLVVPIQIMYQNLAKQMKRDLEIVIGLPNEDIYQKFISDSSAQNVLSLCEFSPIATIKANSKYWAPRWTLGYLDSDINSLHNQNKKVITWTLDVQSFIRKYIRKASFDGILSNYPFLVSYEYYIYKNDIK